MIFEENLQYKHHQPERIEDLPEEWKILMEWIEKGKTILEVGCHTGDLSRWMKLKGCLITGVELNSKAIEEAKPFLEEAIIGNIEDQSTFEKLQDKKFDVILFEHVIEHLQDPWKVLTACKKLLAPNGVLIMALPNISNADSRFKMMRGDFDYEETGVMDRTHLRFFNYSTARELIQESGFKVEEYASPWRVNPVREFIDHLPLLTHLRFLFGKNAPKFLPFSRNLTDVVMLFKCSPC